MQKKKSNISSLFLIVSFIIVLAVISVFAYKYVTDDINGNRTNESNDIKCIVILDGSNDIYDVSLTLENSYIIKNSTVWSYWMDNKYPDMEIVPGEYSVSADMSYDEIAKSLKNPIVTHRRVSVCIPEGFDVFKIASVLDEKGVCSYDDFLSACNDVSLYEAVFDQTLPSNDKVAYSLEGFLFPATYDFYENMEPAKIIDDMLCAFSERIKPEWNGFCDKNGYTMYELVTLASIVERETLGEGVAQNIASVFINRLNIGQKLQSDVTIDYGNKLRSAGFEDEVVFSYNTYKCSALPSGPICNPGVENIDAVVNHNDTDYFYFFSDLQNEFHFAKDYDEFEQLKQKYPWQ